MNKKELKKYLKDHPLDNFSIASLADFQTRFLFQEGIMESIDKIAQKSLPSARTHALQEDAERISLLSTPEEIVKCMRSVHHFGNMTSLATKALENQEETMPLVLKRYMTSFQSCFLENASRVLAHADRKYAEELLERYRDIRSPYAQGLACFIFGFQGMEETISLQIKEVERLRRIAPDDSYYQLPIQALNYLIEKLP